LNLSFLSARCGHTPKTHNYANTNFGDLSRRIVARGIRAGCGSGRFTAGSENLAGGKHDGYYAAYRLSAFYRPDGYANHVTGLQRAFAPATVNHVRRIAGFHDPANRLAIFAFHIELQEAMRIGPEPFDVK